MKPKDIRVIFMAAVRVLFLAPANLVFGVASVIHKEAVETVQEVSEILSEPDEY